MSDKKIRLKYGYDFYKDPSCVDIKSLARNLGIRMYKGRIKCPCPDHADNNPSAQLTSEGRYANQWKCYSCNASGGPIELVVAVNSGISPDDYWKMMKSEDPKEREKGFAVRDEALRYIDSLFPGNIEEDTEKEQEVNGKAKFPNIPKEIYDLIGMKNPRVPARIICPVGQGEDGTVKEDSIFYKPNDAEAADIVLEHMLSYQDMLKKRMLDIFRDYPGIDIKSKIYIANETDKKTDVLEPYINSLRAYLGLSNPNEKGEEDELEI